MTGPDSAAQSGTAPEGAEPGDDLVAFDALLSDGAAASEESKPDVREQKRSAHRSLIPLICGAIIVLGLAVILTAILRPSFYGPMGAGAGTPTPSVAGASARPTPTTTASFIPAAGASTPSGAQASTTVSVPAIPIAELADPAWVKRIAAEGGIPPRALQAYAGAALSLAKTQPGCGLGWNTLAAIGKVESDDGSIDGSHLGANGVTALTIIGPALNGKGKGIAAVRDTDGGKYDRDTTWDHAVGPMQFLPSTWAKYAQDGNRDGVTDMNQIDDAALTAGTYLCSIGGNLTNPQNWIKAIAAYNNSVPYNNQVATVANKYAGLR